MADGRRRPAEAGEGGKASRVLRDRAGKAAMGLAELAEATGYSKSWVSQELFGDPIRVLRKLLFDRPASAGALAAALGWRSAVEMAADLGAFEGTDLQALVAPRPDSTAPDRVKVTIPLRGLGEAPVPLELTVPRHVLDAPGQKALFALSLTLPTVTTIPIGRVAVFAEGRPERRGQVVAVRHRGLEFMAYALGPGSPRVKTVLQVDPSGLVFAPDAILGPLLEVVLKVDSWDAPPGLLP